MVVIDEKDVGKEREDVLIDLIYEATGQRILLSKVVFGVPSEVDPRKDVELDHNTFIPARIDPKYDARYWKDGSGFLYRRRNLGDNFRDIDFSDVQPVTLPFRISDILEQINTHLLYPIKQDDIVDFEYTSLQDVYEKGVHLKADPHSLLWIGGLWITINTDRIDGGPLINVLELDGFNQWFPT